MVVYGLVFVAVIKFRQLSLTLRPFVYLIPSDVAADAYISNDIYKNFLVTAS